MTPKRSADKTLPRKGLSALGLHKHHPFYMAWTNMKSRCDNPNSTQYPWYGGKGIRYCEAWKNFFSFFTDMWDEWSPGLVLDRVDPNAFYEKANCRWVSKEESAQNRTSTILNSDIVAIIRTLYATGKYTQTQLANRFSISQAHISDIILGKTWR